MSGRIYSINKQPAVATVRIALVKSSINKHFDARNEELIARGGKPRLAYQELLKEQLVDVVKLVISGQLETGFRLDLNDDLLVLRLGITARRAKQLRKELKDAGIIFFPEWSRTRKPGDYPFWMVSREFLRFAAEKKSKGVKSMKNKKYIPLYYKYYSMACKNVYRDLVEYDLYVSTKEYMVLVYAELDNILKRVGLSKEDLLAPKI